MAPLEQAWDGQNVVHLSEKLNRELPTTGGWVVVRDGSDETIVADDRLGYLGLGAGLIQGATSPLGTHNGVDNSLKVGVTDLFGERIVTFKCLEDEVAYETWEERSPRFEAALKVGCGVVALGLLALLAIGGNTVFMWFSGPLPPRYTSM